MEESQLAALERSKQLQTMRDPTYSPALGGLESGAPSTTPFAAAAAPPSADTAAGAASETVESIVQTTSAEVYTRGLEEYLKSASPDAEDNK